MKHSSIKPVLNENTCSVKVNKKIWSCSTDSARKFYGIKFVASVKHTHTYKYTHTHSLLNIHKHNPGIMWNSTEHSHHLSGLSHSTQTIVIWDKHLPQWLQEANANPVRRAQRCASLKNFPKKNVKNMDSSSKFSEQWILKVILQKKADTRIRSVLISDIRFITNRI